MWISIDLKSNRGHFTLCESYLCILEYICTIIFYKVLMNFFYCFLFFLLVFFANLQSSFSKNFEFPENVKSISHVMKDLPPYLDSSTTIQDDFNKDGFSDFAIVIVNNKHLIEKSNPVYLGIYFGNSTKMYSLHTTSTTAILPLKFGMEQTFPFSGMTFEKGKLSIFHYFGEELITSIEDTYMFMNNTFSLVQSSNSKIERDNDMVTTTEIYNWQKGIKEVKKNNFHQNFKSKTSKFASKPLKSISQHIPGTIY